MSEEEIEKDEANGKVAFKDKRRFNADGEFVGEDEPAAAPARSAAEAALEEKLKVETERREAAEAKLVGVQAKFEEAKSGLEKETSEMRERLKKKMQDEAKQGQFNFLTTLLPVLDNLNLAIQSSETDPDISHLRAGVVGTARSFEQALVNVGVEPIISVGADFDPELHEAVDMKPVDEAQAGKITTEYSRGYRFGDKLLRPARVQVGRQMADSAGDQ